MRARLRRGAANLMDVLWLARQQLVSAAVLSREEQQKRSAPARLTSKAGGLAAATLGRGKLVPLRWLAAVDECVTETLAQPLGTESFGPRIAGHQEMQPVMAPAVRRYDFTNAGVSPGSSSVLVGDSLIVERPEGATAARHDLRRVT